MQYIPIHDVCGLYSSTFVCFVLVGLIQKCLLNGKLTWMKLKLSYNPTTPEKINSIL